MDSESKIKGERMQKRKIRDRRLMTVMLMIMVAR